MNIEWNENASFLHCQTFFLSQYIAWIRNNIQHLTFLTKCIDNTLQTCVDIATEYLQAYNKGAGVIIHLLSSPHQNKCAGSALFSITIVPLTKFIEIKLNSFT